MFRLECGRTLQRHGAADVDVRGLDLGLGEAEEGQHVEAEIVERRLRDLQGVDAELLTQRPLVEGELDVEGARSEEHTSELQSLMRISYAVFCLKKKKNKQ